MSEPMLFDQSLRGKIKVTGADRTDFLHRILTNDIKSLKPGGACYACLLTAQGKVLVMARVWMMQDFILLETEPGFAESAIKHLDKFLITDDVQLENVTDRYGIISAAGKLDAGFASVPGKEISGPVFHFLVESGKVNDILRKGEEKSLAVWESMRIAAGWPRYGEDFDDTIALPETGLENLAASATKGCYPGQEVVARMETYKGHQKKLVQFILDGEKLPEKGAKVYSGESEIGWITSAASSEGKRIALGYAAKGHFENAEAVQIKSSAGILAGKIKPLRPFA